MGGKKKICTLFYSKNGQKFPVDIGITEAGCKNMERMDGIWTNGKWRACGVLRLGALGMVGKARENGKLTVARQAGLYNPEIKGVLYPAAEEEEEEWIRSRRKVVVGGW